MLVAVIIKLDSKGPVFFRQVRFGKDKQPFTIYKFRTMTTEAPKNVATNDFANASAFITRSGKIMRQLSIDELPQFINILKGDMSLIGPRPVILKETDLIVERDKYNANCRTPGITGWAQANGRDEIDICEKARMDGEYCEKFGLLMDLCCVLKTIETMLLSKGYNEGTRKTVFPQTAQLTPASPSFYARVRTNAKFINRPAPRHSSRNRVI